MPLFSSKKSKIKIQKSKSDSFSGWLKCVHCHEMIHAKELEKTSNCCPKCDYHYRLTAQERIDLITDQDSFVEKWPELTSTDPLLFADRESYPDRLQRAEKKSGRNDAVVVGTCTIERAPLALAVMDFHFMGGSMGSVVGEKITRIIEEAVKEKLPVVIVSASGGARMQESSLSLMQMAKTASALGKLHKAKLPFISVLTNPTLGGVTASFASLGDVILAEPNALIGFAGPRVIEQTIGHKLPEDAQKSEFLLKHGMIDAVVKRSELKKKLASFIDYLSGEKS